MLQKLPYRLAETAKKEIKRLDKEMEVRIREQEKALKEFKVLVKMLKSIETDKFRLKVYREILKR